eukprot:scaffold85889_cov39-Tisochrysis_lutea.AAC.1
MIAYTPNQTAPLCLHSLTELWERKQTPPNAFSFLFIGLSDKACTPPPPPAPNGLKKRCIHSVKCSITPSKTNPASAPKHMLTSAFTRSQRSRGVPKVSSTAWHAASKFKPSNRVQAGLSAKTNSPLPPRAPKGPEVFLRCPAQHRTQHPSYAGP